MTGEMRALPAILILATTGAAHAGDADDPPAKTDRDQVIEPAYSEGTKNGLHVIPGINIGGAHAPGDTGFLLGGEISVAVVHWKYGHYGRDNPNDYGPRSWPTWAGVYGDVVRDFTRDATRISVGPEIGYAVFGIDGGYVHQTTGEGRDGFVIRPVLTLGLLQGYFRFGHFADDLPGANFQEFGILLKVGPSVVHW